MRYKTLDKTYSYVADKAESAAFYSESQFIGVGLSTQRSGESDLRIAQVFPGSPASDAGLERGDYLLDHQRQGGARPHPYGRDRHHLRRQRRSGWW